MGWRPHSCRVAWAAPKPRPSRFSGFWDSGLPQGHLRERFCTSSHEVSPVGPCGRHGSAGGMARWAGRGVAGAEQPVLLSGRERPLSHGAGLWLRDPPRSSWPSRPCSHFLNTTCGPACALCHTAHSAPSSQAMWSSQPSLVGNPVQRVM